MTPALKRLLTSALALTAIALALLVDVPEDVAALASDIPGGVKGGLLAFGFGSLAAVNARRPGDTAPEKPNPWIPDRKDM